MELGPHAPHRPPWKSAGPGLLGPPGPPGQGWTTTPPEGSGPHPHPARGRDRSLALWAEPHYRGELLGLAEEPDGCGGGGEAPLAPWPGLNIYYVLFGLWGKGGEDCGIDPELPARPGPAQGRGRCPKPCPHPFPAGGAARPLGRGLLRAEPRGPADRSGLSRWAAGAPLPAQNRAPLAGAALFATRLAPAGPPARSPEPEPRPARPQPAPAADPSAQAALSCLSSAIASDPAAAPGELHAPILRTRNQTETEDRCGARAGTGTPPAPRASSPGSPRI